MSASGHWFWFKLGHPDMALRLTQHFLLSISPRLGFYSSSSLFSFRLSSRPGDSHSSITITFPTTHTSRQCHLFLHSLLISIIFISHSFQPVQLMMVCLSSRFLCLAALVAAAAMPSYVIQADARAVGIATRHHGNKVSSVSHSVSSASSKGKGTPEIPLPPSTKGKSKEGKKAKKHKKGGKKHDKRVSLPRPCLFLCSVGTYDHS